jgi:hypothetical protein
VLELLDHEMLKDGKDQPVELEKGRPLLQSTTSYTSWGISSLILPHVQVLVKTNAAYAVSSYRPEEYSQHHFSGISQAFLQPHHHSAKEIFWLVNNKSSESATDLISYSLISSTRKVTLYSLSYTSASVPSTDLTKLVINYKCSAYSTFHEIVWLPVLLLVLLNNLSKILQS